MFNFNRTDEVSLLMYVPFPNYKLVTFPNISLLLAWDRPESLSTVDAAVDILMIEKIRFIFSI